MLSRFAFAALIGLAAIAPAHAGDDGQASLLSGLASTFGLTPSEDPQIEYRERSKLVVPPKKALPPPAASARAALPTDNDVARARAEKKLEEGGPSARDFANRGGYLLVPPGTADVKVTTSGFDKRGPACRVPNPKTGECPAPPSPTVEWNPLTWVGVQKKPEVVMGPEPERQTLIDPPKGLRAPAQGVGAKVEN